MPTDLLVKIATTVELFHTASGIAFADLLIDGHRETWPIRSTRFRVWLRQRYYEATGAAPNPAEIRSALDLLEARAQFDAPEQAVHVRLAEHAGRIYLDLADARWRAVEVGPDGWQVIGSPPVRFRRPAGMLPLPLPVRGGSIEALGSLLNLPHRNDFVLVVAWLLATLRSGGPHPLLAVAGEQGSAKTVLSKVLKALIDPHAAPVRALARDERELMIAATHSHLLAFDNLSSLPAFLSDALCRIASGGSLAVRRLYTDEDEMLFQVARPILLNGIENVVSRADLADRAIFLTLAPIAEQQRRSEAELWSEFERARPAILGALLDAVAHGLRTLPRVRLERLPRMADFAIWATACETAFWSDWHLHALLRDQSQGLDRGRRRRRPGGSLRSRDHGRAQHLERDRRRPAAGGRRSQRRGSFRWLHRLAQKPPRARRPIAPGANVPAGARHRHRLRS